jgi:hypothetical protein
MYKIGFFILLAAFVALGGFTYYALTVSAPAAAEKECEAYIMSTVVPQAEAECQAGVEQLMAGLNQYESLIAQLSAVPACAAYIPAPEAEATTE